MLTELVDLEPPLWTGLIYSYFLILLQTPHLFEVLKADVQRNNKITMPQGRRPVLVQGKLYWLLLSVIPYCPFQARPAIPHLVGSSQKKKNHQALSVKGER